MSGADDSLKYVSYMLYVLNRAILVLQKTR